MNPKVTAKFKHLMHFNIVQSGNLMDPKIVKYNHVSIEPDASAWATTAA